MKPDDFCFPDKFAFVDIDLARLVRACGPCRRLTLHLPVVNMPVDTPSGRALEMLSATHLRLFCSPVVNLFKREAVPVVLKSGVYTYPIAPQALLMQGIEVHSIDAVRMTPHGAPDAQGSIVIPPFHGLVHEPVHERSIDTPAPYWIAHRDRREHPGSPLRQAELTFVDRDGTPIKPDTDQIAIDLTCTNADRPSALPFGTPDGDLLNENENLAARISLLRRASPSQTRPQDPGTLWRLIAGMTPHALTLQPSGLSGLKDLLNLHLAGASRAAPQIDAITRLDHKSVVQWMALKPMSTFVRGIEIALTVDESAFTAFSLHTFSGVIDRFFAPYAPSNGFVRLVIHATGSGRELRRCRPQFGASPLL
ncbi:type VI secretion system baseplate subunit TssF [Paraburkholderia lacunae]|uniref:type VI secretion system baseplate subunit TssF n=1 Tax=Paraburkholderia lacunae TaxID=2211104 RepID=UPI001404182D|nr:type VI secretion system baseplate subunit TssF [Paraburkholderia lacunae]